MSEIIPVRIQRSRKQKQVSPNSLPIVYVGRPSKFGNPFTIMGSMREALIELTKMDERMDNLNEAKSLTPYARAIALQKYKNYLNENPGLVNLAKETLKGKNLSCWCSLQDSCHADILIEICNQ